MYQYLTDTEDTYK